MPSGIARILAGLEEPPSTPWRIASTFGVVPLVLVFLLLVTGHFAYTPDDTYIYMQYARNIAEGNGFAFNAGVPTYGITGPLWALLIAAGAAGGLDPYVVAKVFDLVFASAALLAVYLLGIVLLRNRVYAFLSAVVVGLDAWFLRWTTSGMETSLGMLLAVLAVWYAYRNQYSVAGFIAGVLTLVRPEGALLLVILVADNFVNSRDRRRSLSDALRMAAVFLIPVLPWLVFAFGEFGTILPNTLRAKFGWTVSISELSSTTWAILRQLGATQALTAIVATVGSIVLLRGRHWDRIRAEFFPALWVVSLILFYVLGDIQVVSRYLLLAIPFVVLGAFWALRRMAELRIVSQQLAGITAIGLCLVSVAQNQYVYESRIVPHLRGFERGTTEVLKPIGFWLNAHAPAQATVLAPDVGVIGYVSQRAIADVAGLITPGMRDAFRGMAYDEGMRAAAYRRVLAPDFIVDRALTPDRLASPQLRPVMSGIFPGLGIAKSDSVTYTLYRVLK